MKSQSSDNDKRNSQTGKKGILERMKEKWGLQSMWQVVIILIVFALTGTTVVLLRPLIFHLLGIDNANGWLKTISYLVLVFPMYQGLLLFYGFIFGQFGFFWDKEKKMVQALGRVMGIRKR